MTEKMKKEYQEILSPGAFRFAALLQTQFNDRRKRLMEEREALQQMWDRGTFGKFLDETRPIREGDWQADPVPAEMEHRPVEITGPAQDPKMVINALNSAALGVTHFMADFEDSSGEKFENLMDGQIHLKRANERTLAFHDKQSGKKYSLNKNLAVLMVRPRGLHLEERHIAVDGEPISASIFDFSLYLYHNHKLLQKNKTAPYFYLPKLESWKEALWWNELITNAEKELKIPVGTIKVTVLVETLPQSFQIEEIIWALRNHMAGVNAGRWDYIFSFIKKLRNHPQFLLPDRKSVTMKAGFMKAYVLNLIRAAHKRGVHAMGGMSAFIPTKDPKTNKIALQKVKEDKELEFFERGHDGTWIAHPGLAQLARSIADQAFGKKKNQKERHYSYTDVLKELLPKEQFQKGKEYSRAEYEAIMEKLLIEPAKGEMTDEGVRNNASVGVEYLANFLVGRGAVAIHNMMEDLATAEISRVQLWQWVAHRAKTKEGMILTPESVRAVIFDELKKLQTNYPDHAAHLRVAAELFAHSVTDEEFDNFIPDFAYSFLDHFEKVVARQKADGKPLMNPKQVEAMREDWDKNPRWRGIRRNFSPHPVLLLRSAIDKGTNNHAIARKGAKQLWHDLHHTPFVRTFGALNGAQATQMVKAGLTSIYTSGWQTAAGNNIDNDVFPDQSVYQAASVPEVVDEYNKAFARQSKIHRSEGTRVDIDWFVPIVADAEAGFGGILNQFELMRNMIRAGAAAVHFEDQVGAEKKCGHLGGKVLVPTQMFVETLNTARLAADVEGVETILIARTDADSAQLLLSDIDPYDKPLQIGIVGGDNREATYFNSVDFARVKEFLSQPKIQEAGGARSKAAIAAGFMTYDDAEKKGLAKKWKPLRDAHKGYWLVHGGVEGSIRRALAYAPYADLIWMETSHPSVEEFRQFSEGVRAHFKHKLFAYNCSPSFNWLSKLTVKEIATFQEEMAALGAKFQFITLAGIHGTWLQTFDFARRYKEEGMKAYVEMVQKPEFERESEGYTGVKHQREVGTGYYDMLAEIVSSGRSMTKALAGSTELAQFKVPEKTKK